jgi:hypothetical protein
MNTGEIVATCAIYAACRINQLRNSSSALSHPLSVCVVRVEPNGYGF